MSNEELMCCFENDALPEDSFHHADHVRLAFAYLCEYPVLQALEKFSAALKRFAAARAKTQLYNETITCAYFFLIRQRMAGCEGVGWEEFSRHNADLLIWKGGILSRYYREATLKSDLARKVFVLPDRCFSCKRLVARSTGSNEEAGRASLDGTAEGGCPTRASHQNESLTKLILP